MTTPSELPVRVLTVKQPWAWAIARGYKRIENRGYKPSRPYRLLIHAGRKYDLDAAEFITSMGLKIPARERLAAGVIVCRVDVLDWEWGTANSAWAEQDAWNWHLTNRVTARPPVPCRGRVTLFPPPQGWEQSFTRA